MESVTTTDFVSVKHQDDISTQEQLGRLLSATRRPNIIWAALSVLSPKSSLDSCSQSHHHQHIDINAGHQYPILGY